ncbi:YafY family protein [Deinococcus sp. Leaf326]|uniref:helix-turn-helix transcriptional regulator n=1 Tax=Deinococcus sp. Leaf326 TaxID=1736338 RepID=UPI0006FF4479|nr:YafY family protein [Deinococcus sp. Leaf326]KQR22851.1 repressor [Deinococcus sp. Leaf326]
MYDPSMRVLSVLELLQSRESVTGAELSRVLEVSPRSVQRYVARLQDLGIPVEGRRGVGGAYRLRPGFRLPPLMFSGEEALSLSLGLLALGHLGLRDLAPAADLAAAKLARTLPDTLREEVRALRQAVQLDAAPWVVTVEATHMGTLLTAMRQGRQIEFSYRSGRGEGSVRRADLYRAVHFDGRWYAVGHCHLRGERRSFRLDRMAGVRVLDDTFTPPADFDAVAWLRASLPAPAQAQGVSVWLGAPPESLRAQLSGWGTELLPEGGGSRLRGQRDHLDAFAGFLLGLGCEIRVDGPPELLRAVERVAARAQAVLAPPVQTA